ncbi:MAG: hypothetical protein AAGF11_07715 [Myxococcota bacterium]
MTTTERPRPASEQEEVEAVVAAIKGSRKYRAVSVDTIRALTRQAYPEHRKRKALDKAVRRRLHGIVASHLGDPEYEGLAASLADALARGDAAQERVLCAHALRQHLSTRERWPYLTEFYAAIFEHTGQPGTVLDLACALGPLALPWMGLPATTELWAYDIHEPRVALIDGYLRQRGQAGGAEVRDIVLDPPRRRADVVLLLKELHRLQRNYPRLGSGLGSDWLAALPAQHLVVSLPAISAHGGRRLTTHYRQMIHRLVDGRGWAIQEIGFEHEVVFCLDTRPG